MKKQIQWIFRDQPSLLEIENFSKSLFGNISEITQIICSLLLQRGVKDFEQARSFFRPSIDFLHNPFQMKDMQKAVERIDFAIKNQEKILIFGDYDVDGSVAVSLLYLFLNEFYDKVAYYLPDRYDEGYGFSYKGVDFAYDNEVSLIITLDCGIRDNEKVAYAKSKSIDVIVTDHHLPADELPLAYAILNPKQPQCTYPYKELCGCAVGFKLIQALCQFWQVESKKVLKYLDLVALATAADIVPVTGENRILCTYGLEKINQRKSTFLKPFVDRLPKEIKLSDLVFFVAPRINAAGRIHHASKVVELLTIKQPEQKELIYQQIEQWNTYRKELEQQIIQEAIQQIIDSQQEHNFVIVVFAPHWHKGVIGIVASKLVEMYHRPSFVFTQSNQEMVASVRSVQGYDIHQAIQQCRTLLKRFGGHKYAAGLTLDPMNYQVFKQKIEAIVRSEISSELRLPRLIIDKEIPLKAVNTNLYRLLKQFQPTGPENLSPVFVSRNVVDAGSRVVGDSREHLKLLVKDPDPQSNFTIQGIGFSLGYMFSKINMGCPFDIAYTIEENHWNGQRQLQLQVIDIKIK